MRGAVDGDDVPDRAWALTGSISATKSGLVTVARSTSEVAARTRQSVTPTQRHRSATSAAPARATPGPQKMAANRGS